MIEFIWEIEMSFREERKKNEEILSARPLLNTFQYFLCFEMFRSYKLTDLDVARPILVVRFFLSPLHEFSFQAPVEKIYFVINDIH